MIGRLRRILSSALGRSLAEPDAPVWPRRGRARDAEERIDEARRRLKATIPPPED